MQEMQGSERSRGKSSPGQSGGKGSLLTAPAQALPEPWRRLAGISGGSGAQFAALEAGLAGWALSSVRHGEFGRPLPAAAA